MSTIAPAPNAALLPLKAVTITLEFTSNAQLPFFHQPIVNAWLRHLGKLADYENYLSIDTPESGCIQYHKQDLYRFSLLCIRGGENQLQTLLEKLQALPGSVTHNEAGQALRDNLKFHSAHDLFQGQAINHSSELTPYTEQSLAAEMQLWQHAPTVLLRCLSPLRLLLPKAQRKDYTGEARFCRQTTELDFKLLQQSLYNSLNALLRKHRQPVMAMPETPGHFLEQHLFWMDNRYGADNKQKPMGGFLGLLQLDTRHFTPENWSNWVLGQYLGIGRFRVFGWGRYQLEGQAGETSLPRCQQATTLLKRSIEPDNFSSAYQVVADNQQHKKLSARSNQSGVDVSEPDIDEAETQDGVPLERLQRIATQLKTETYAIPPLRGVILPQAGRDPRPLSIPPFMDRVAQRAVAQTLTPALETLMYRGSFGYRRGRSRHNAAKMIQQAYTAGYRWVYESDIDDFFDNVLWSHVHTRLRALFGTDPLIDLIMSWISAPLTFEKQVITRHNGLPQGSPLSPLLANLLLDDFDSDLETAGYKLIRFADDFVILGTSREEVEQAGQLAAASVSELGLQLNSHKTFISDFNQGFRFLGYLFVNSLALDVGGEKDLTHAPSTPPNSWLAKVEPQTSAKTSEALPNPKPETIDKKTAIKLGERESLGIMLFISGDSALLTTREERLHIEQKNQPQNPAKICDFAWNNLQAVVLFGFHHITTPALKAAFKHQVAIHYASNRGLYQGMSSSVKTYHDNSALWLAQHLCFQHEVQALSAAKSIVKSRLRHQSEILRRRNPDKQLNTPIQQLQGLTGKIDHAPGRDNLNGYEGQGAKIYFQALQSLIPEAFGFSGRNRRPPRDPFNVLLSLGYTVLYSHVETLCHVSGLQPWVGLYHEPHGRHAVLASDLMEPFRHIVERVALSAVRRKQITPDDFSTQADGSCYMAGEARKKYLALLSEAFETPFQARNDEQAYKLHEHLHRQNLQLIQWIRGKIPQFQAWRMH
ncbi:CRISPR-associated endonuclease Cas1 [Candidatus Venteria ishoeyi]|uniref:CRISPR-associated endonuclease Cas1 n=1 Tax=Candidatus Venteria ishoeyi TaxID=1899563 RepID=A0A1H6FI77_9GAMM|nr:CRISPR-associated endonuclease Cas1 [Candidatus Venteria ishoeyi]SEH08755.1 Group II intron-encoded protein LtrA [Candidatus Venteria ishoeyi]